MATVTRFVWRTLIHQTLGLSADLHRTDYPEGVRQSSADSEMWRGYDQNKPSRSSVMLLIGRIHAVFCWYLSTNCFWKNPHCASKQARVGLHIDTNDHTHYQIFGGRNCKIRQFFTSCMIQSLPYSRLCKCIKFLLPTTLSLLWSSGLLSNDYSSADFRQYFANISSANRSWSHTKNAFRWAR